MAHARMHDDEVDTDEALVRALLAEQHPEWADLPIARVVSAGTDNAMYRLGDELAVRLPRIHWAVDVIAKERRWLPWLAARLPVAVPEIVAVGAPDPVRFPYPWNIVRWLPGEMATPDRIDDPVRFARELAAAVQAVRSLDPSDGPQHHRGAPVRLAADSVYAGVDGLRPGDGVDGDAVLAAWARVSRAPDHDGPPVWFHGDLAYLNLLVAHGALAGVIDWGTCGIGDPAIDAIVAWTLLEADARSVYRELLRVDDAAWDRAKAWVLTGVYGVPYYRATNPLLVADKVRGINAVLADEGLSG
jgi:aminoglycoside phosphotransferase (APT) family kinase protein